MPEWRSYSLDDFVMFTGRTLDRLLESHNRALWPWHVAALGAAAAVLLLFRHRSSAARRVAPVLVAAAWLVAAWAWLWIRYATIHTYGRAMAAAFALEAALLVVFAVTSNRFGSVARLDLVARIGIAILSGGLLLHPLLAPVLGRPWTRAELFALTPDPTVAATLGFLLATVAPWYLWPVPLAWSLFSGATAYALRSPTWWILPTIAVVAVACEVSRRTARRTRA